MRRAHLGALYAAMAASSLGTQDVHPADLEWPLHPQQWVPNLARAELHEREKRRTKKARGRRG